MIGHHLYVARTLWREAPALVFDLDGPVAISYEGLSTPMVLAAQSELWARPVVPWLVIDDRFSSPVAARDIKTLCWLMNISDVLLSSPLGNLNEHAEIIWRLLTEDDVTIDNGAARLLNAYNRPLPLTPPAIWVTQHRPTESVARWQLAEGNSSLLALDDDVNVTSTLLATQ